MRSWISYTREMKYVLIVSLIIWSLFACKKEVPYADASTTEISITFKSPTDNGILSVGEESHIEGIIDANAMMSGWSILMTRANGDTIGYYQDLYDQTQYLFHSHWIPTYTDTGTINITASALDKGFDVLKSASITVECQ